MPCEVQSVLHEDLLQQLLDVTQQLRAALVMQDLDTGSDDSRGDPVWCAKDVDALKSVALEHAKLSEALIRAGMSDDARLMPLTERVRAEVQDIMIQLEFWRSRTLESLALQERRRQGAAAYVKEASRPSRVLQSKM